MAKAIETLSIKLEFKDAGTQQIISKLSSSLKGMTNVVAGNTSPAISKLRNEILSVGKASTQSISNFRNQANALRALRDEARVGSATFKKLTEDIKKLDAQMAKAQRPKRGGIGARATTQIAGAVVSGGIFGGPEGALGALGGAALGGVQGAFAGAAIGAQLKGLRELAAGAADYAAQVQKLEIALQGVAGSQDNYNSALQAARQVTEDFNVPTLDSIRGITRLSAAVTGAGGPIRDAETTFRNVTAAIKATGGSTEDVRGAVTAMVQVFSKGKVSAEELSGQLGERLPGAVTLFAKANDMTLPELQKNLKAGTVGLNELMKFIVELGNTYAGTASKIADSNAEAGARLSVAVQDMQAEVGAALLPIGAQFQEAFTEFIRSITPFLVENLPKLGQLFLSLSKNIDTVAVAAAAALAVFSAAKIAAIIAGIGGIGKALVLLKAKLVAVALANPFTALALAVGVFAGALYNASKEQARLNRLIKEGTVAEVDAAVTAKQSELDKQISKRLAIDPTGKGTSQMQALFQEGGSEYQTEERLRKELTALRERRRTARYDETQGAAVLDPGSFKPFDYEAPDPEGEPTSKGRGTRAGAKSTLARRLEQAQALENRMQRQLLLAQQQGQIGKLLAQQANERAQLQEQITALTKDGTSAELEKTAASAKSLLLKKQEKEREEAIQSLRDQANIQVREAMIAASGLGEEEMKRVEIMRTLAEFAAKFKEVLTDEEMLEALQSLRDALTELQKGAKDAGDSFDATFRKSLEDMIDIGPKLASVASSAIASISDGLVEMIATGEANFKEMAASILKEIAKILLQAAIAKTIKLFLSADGNVIQGGRIKPYAKGGVVAGPTLFPMAGGDVGLMGEAGPEAIMPLKRGANGRLGVEVAGRSNAIDAMNRYSGRNNSGGSIAPSALRDETVASVQSAPQPIDVRYTVERINNVDYVTADQFQAGMRQAANQGAKQGEQQTLKRLQMSGGTRRRLGM